MHAAHLGTLFVDYLDAMPPSVQAKLARVLEVHLATPLGRTRPRAADFRLIAASREPLARGVMAGRLSAELAVRFGTDAITIPPLRFRREDIVAIFEHALRRGGTHKDVTSAFVEALCLYDWPFNVRELVQLAWLLSISSEPTLDVGDLPERFGAERSASGSGSRPRAKSPRVSTQRRRPQDWDESSYV